MKTYLFILLMLPLRMFGLTQEVEAVQSVLPTNNAQSINQALVDLKMAINDHELNDGSPYNNPSPARAKTRKEVKEALEAIKNELVGLAASSDATVASSASNVLGYSNGGKEVYDTLRQNLAYTASSGVASASLFSLFQMGAADKEVRELAVERIAKFQNAGDGEVAFSLLHLGAVWPLPEALDTYREILRTDRRDGAKISAVNAIVELGPGAAQALPELQKFLQQLEQQGGDFRFINTLKRAIEVVGGQSDESAVVDQSKVTSALAQSTPVPPMGAHSPLPSPTAAETKSLFGFPIVPMAIIVALIMGILLYLRYFKSK